MAPPDSRPAADPVVYRLAGRADWARAREAGVYEGSADDARDGFIHLSAAHQLVETARKHYAGRGDLVLLAVDAVMLAADLRWEVSRGGDLFPHLYAKLPARAVLWAHDIEQGADGAAVLPDGLAGEGT